MISWKFVGLIPSREKEEIDQRPPTLQRAVTIAIIILILEKEEPRNRGPSQSW
jgi:hypothetical protein